MRRVVISNLIVALFAATAAIAQVPKTISYQGILTDGSGIVVPDDIYHLTLKLYSVDINGQASWTEVQDVTSVGGLFNVVLGAKTPLRLLFDRQLWLGISVGTEAELSPRIKLTSASYSIRAQRADTADFSMHALRADLADKADDAATVGGYSVSATPAANKILPLDASGKIPASAIPSVPAIVQDNSLTAVKIASGEVVKSINTMHDDVELVAGSNVSIAPSGNTLIISATPGGGGGDITGIVATDGLAGGGTSGDVVVTIADQGVTTQRLADDAVTDAKIPDNTVIRSLNNITDNVELTAGQNIAITPAGNTIMIEGTSSGDITAVNTPPGSGLIGGAQSGDISLAIEDGGVTTAKLADGAVTSDKIADAAITSAKLADLSVTNAKIDDQSIDFTKISSSGSSEGEIMSIYLGNADWRAPEDLILPFDATVDEAGPAFRVENTSTSFSGDAIVGLSNTEAGIAGVSSTGIGVHGAVTDPGGTAGVYGDNPYGSGVIGTSNASNYPAVYGTNVVGDGVLGSSGTANKSGVLGRHSVSNGYAVRGVNSSSTNPTSGYLGGERGASGSYGTQYTGQLGSNLGAVVGVHASGTNWAVLGASAQACYVNGGFYQLGGVFAASPTSTLWTTNKPATVKLNDGTKVKLFAEEATEVVFADYGEGQLNNGRVHIALDSEFLQTVTIDAQHPLKVFVQLEDDCNGVYITNKSSSGFDVAELQRGQSNARFSYRVVCKRKYYEDERLASEEEDVSFNTNMLSTAWPELNSEHEAMNDQVQKMKQKEVERISLIEREPPKLPELKR